MIDISSVEAAIKNNLYSNDLPLKGIGTDSIIYLLQSKIYENRFSLGLYPALTDYLANPTHIGDNNYSTGGVAGVPTTTPQPISPSHLNYSGEAGATIKTMKGLNQAFQDTIATVAARMGMPITDLMGILKGEDSSFSTTARTGGYVGIAQLGHSAVQTAKSNWQTYINSDQSGQLLVAEQYWWNSGYTFGAGIDAVSMIQAAPAFLNRPNNTIVYAVGSAAWNGNPGWRGPDGTITVGSIKAYYRKAAGL